jgi:hypothetical protein
MADALWLTHPEVWKVKAIHLERLAWGMCFIWSLSYEAGQVPCR